MVNVCFCLYTRWCGREKMESCKENVSIFSSLFDGLEDSISKKAVCCCCCVTQTRRSPPQVFACCCYVLYCKVAVLISLGTVMWLFSFKWPKMSSDRLSCANECPSPLASVAYQQDRLHLLHPPHLPKLPRGYISMRSALVISMMWMSFLELHEIDFVHFRSSFYWT
jgi:hypothetical protein